MLVLRKQKAVELAQTEPYGDIIISQGPSYQSLLATAFWKGGGKEGESKDKGFTRECFWLFRIFTTYAFVAELF